MSDENKSINEFDFNLICDYYSAIERQGPGSPEMTLKALSFIDNLNCDSRIADLGCGTGGQTMTLGKHTTGQITGLDLFPKFIDIFNSNAKKLNMHNRVRGIVGSMDSLSFREEELDLIWSEGSIYNIGYVRGLNYWRQFLKTGGYVAVSEASWFTDSRPDKIHDFWMDAYPEMDTIPNKIAQMQKAGYIPVASFIFPESCWIDNFYVQEAKAEDAFLKKYAGNKAAENFVSYEQYERQLYYKYKDFYGYVFYIGKKI